LEACLQIVPSQRTSVQALLKHPFIRSVAIDERENQEETIEEITVSPMVKYEPLLAGVRRTKLEAPAKADFKDKSINESD
jgi:hypothetical protein